MLPAAMLLPVAFAAFGILWGAWQAVLPDLARHFGLGSGPLGTMLSVGFVAALPAMLVTGRVLDRVGTRWAVAIPAVAMAAALATIAVLPATALVVAAVVVLVAASGAYDVAINGAALADAAWSRPARMTLLHAAFSGGGAVGAFGAGLVIGGGAPFATTYAVLAAVLLLMGAIAAAAGWPRAPVAPTVVPGVAWALVPLAGLAALAFVAEGSMETWSAIYLREELGAVALVGAMGPAAFHLAMLGGRLAGAGVAGLLGAPNTLLGSGLLIAVGMGTALLTNQAAVAIVGLATAALGASFAVPIIVSLAAPRAGAHGGRAASYVLTMGYAGFLVGPSLVGIGAEVVGLRAALFVIPAAAAVIAAASRTRVARR
jgi:hypothetical protein